MVRSQKEIIVQRFVWSRTGGSEKPRESIWILISRERELGCTGMKEEFQE